MHGFVSPLQVKAAFVHAIPITAEDEGGARRFLESEEFVEAVMRLTRAFQPARQHRSDPAARVEFPVQSGGDEGERSSHEQQRADEEAGLARKLPEVCGKLLMLVNDSLYEA